MNLIFLSKTDSGGTCTQLLTVLFELIVAPFAIGPECEEKERILTLFAAQSYSSKARIDISPFGPFFLVESCIDQTLRSFPSLRIVADST